ncbi:hypothetical protein A0J61_10452 [Choanephora cucurbitarum]|uniref:Uncharacterized protein n=1 Tax=Choanephora cucurbitarum TaxID=101091 RepID=A0A1C7MXJ3_9FUNG|nr:hypothetical protein A0J61_10452 [Choanephora cucurbitarum]
MQTLKSKYSSTKSMVKKVEAFEETNQLVGESSANFFVRVSEMAAKAKITDETSIFRRFRYGLLPHYFKHCQALGADSHAEYYKFFQGLWKNQVQNQLLGIPYSVNDNEVVENVSKVVERKSANISEVVPFNIENLKSMIEDVIDRKINIMHTENNQSKMKEPYQYNGNNNRYQDKNRPYGPNYRNNQGYRNQQNSRYYTNGDQNMANNQQNQYHHNSGNQQGKYYQNRNNQNDNYQGNNNNQNNQFQTRPQGNYPTGSNYNNNQCQNKPQVNYLNGSNYNNQNNYQQGQIAERDQPNSFNYVEDHRESTFNNHHDNYSKTKWVVWIQAANLQQ